jgi:glucose-6-phosphate 1-dehydrogenase
MTFRSLYRLEKRGLLTCPVVGVAVDDWTLDQLVERARTSIVATGEDLDEAVFGRFVERLSYVKGDFVVRGLSEAGLTANATVLVEKPFGHDQQSATALAAELHQYIAESQLFRIDHYLGRWDWRRSST